jgi:putative membrane protein insertion efficiency factor
MKPSDPFLWTIRGYQRLISRHMPPVCRFYPSCSQYAVGAIRVHGVWRGSVLAAWRILRCNPFSPGGDDPVPPRAAELGAGRGE